MSRSLALTPGPDALASLRTLAPVPRRTLPSGAGCCSSTAQSRVRKCALRLSSRASVTYARTAISPDTSA